MSRFYLLIIVLIVTSTRVTGQIDTEFWFAPPEVTSGHGDRPIHLRISTLDDEAIVTIELPARELVLQVLTIAPGATSTVTLSDLISDLETDKPNEVMRTGLKITASQPVTMYYEVGSYLNAEIFVLKGRNGLGNEFMIPWQNTYNNATDYSPPPYASFDVVATADNTVVTVSSSNPVEGHEGQQPITISLNTGETYSFKKPGSLAINNFAGTKVSSSRPIAITLKDDSVIKDGGCRDLIGDQLIPIKVTGKEYIVPRGFLTSPEYIFVMATEDNTDVFVSGINVPVASLSSGQMHRIEVYLPAISIVATKRVYVLHVTGFGCEVAMSVLPPVNCTGSKRVSFTRSTIEFFGVNILARKEAIQYFRMVNKGKELPVPASKFVAVAGTGGEWFTAQIAYNTDDAPIGAANVLTNDHDSFQAGFINGNAVTTCRYGYFSSFSVLFIGDDTKICAGQSLLIDAGPGKQSYQWSNGATSQSITIHEPGQYWVTTKLEECTLSDTLQVDVRKGNIDLPPEMYLCDNSTITLDGRDNASWLWSDGTTQRYLKITQVGKYAVDIIDKFGCAASDSVDIKPYVRHFDPLTELQLHAVSVDTLVESDISVSWRIARSDLLSGSRTSLFRRRDDEVTPEAVATFGDTVHTYTDHDRLTRHHTYSYYLTLSDQCGEQFLQTPWHNSILLQGESTASNDNIAMIWNSYHNWTGVDRYELWRKLDGGTGYRFYLSFGGADTEFADKIGDDAFVHQYIIRAVSADGDAESWSNAIQFNFDHELSVPNVFTPNGDQYNQYFEIPKLELYHDNELTIYDRWGMMVYQNAGYSNDWSGGELSTGVYYYVLQVKRTNKLLKGTVTILR